MMHLVDIILITKNHEKYISDCMRGISSQKVDFGVRLILINDASTDSTTDLIAKELENFPFTVEMITHAKSIGIRQNVQLAASKIQSKYVAFIDGDDYWSYDRKLQHQVEFLELHEEFIGCFHDTIIKTENYIQSDLFQDDISYHLKFNFSDSICLTEIIQRQIIPTSSVVLRSSTLAKINWEFLSDELSCFWKILCFVVNDSRLKFIDEKWSIYNNHNNGISKSMGSSTFHLSHFRFFKKIVFKKEFIGFQFQILSQLLKELELVLERSSLGKRKYFLALEYLFYTILRIKFLLK
jgi:glycosyltransferase involved in cell wall biosynthesis